MTRNTGKKHNKAMAVILAGALIISAAIPMTVSAAQLPQENIISSAATVAPNIKNTSATVGDGETMSVSYMGKSAAKFSNYTVKSSNPSVLKAWRYGSIVKYTGLKPGTATITVTEKNTGAKDSIYVTVKNPVNPKLTKSSVTMTIGDTQQISYMGVSADLFRFYKVTSSNSKVVSASRYGSVVRLTAKSAGTATVTVTACDGVKTSMKVTVNKQIVKPSISIDSTEIAVGETAQISYMGKSAAPFSNYIITSSNSKVVQAVRYGSVVRYKGAGTGTATITVKEKNSGATDSFKVSARRAVAPSFEDTQLVVKPGGDPVYVSYMPKSADEFSYYTIKSSNSRVATASRYGSTVKITPKAEGDITITVTSISGDKATINVKVTSKTWHEAVYKDVYHPAETEQVWVVDQEASTEKVPVYWERTRTICYGCGMDITDDLDEHLDNHVLSGERSNYGSEYIWCIYDTDEWVIKNEDAGKTELVISDDPNSSGEYYMTPAGLRGEKRAKKEAQEMMNSLFATGDYEFQTRYLVRCHSCGETLMDIIDDTDTKTYEEAKKLWEEHEAAHEAKGERHEGGYWISNVLSKIETTPEQGHYETVVVKEAWTEKVLVQEAGWY